MEFLKEILGEELFGQVSEKLNAHNGNEANKDKQIKLGNLGSGEYVGKGKHDSEIEKLNGLLSGKQTELDTANGLIAELQKATKGNEEMQGKFSEYQKQVAQLQAQLQETKVNAAVKVALLAAKAEDIGYLTYKIHEMLTGEGKTLELDDNENIKGWDDILSGLKTQLPNHFKSAPGNGGFLIDPKPLPQGDDRNTAPSSLAEALQQKYDHKE